MPFDRVPKGRQLLTRVQRHLDRERRVGQAVRHEDRRGEVGGIAFGGETARERQIRGERHDARQAQSPPLTSSGTTGTKSLPSAPSPCSQMMAAWGVAEVSISMVSSCIAGSLT